MIIDVVEIQEILPHRFPFLLIDRVTELKVGESIEAFKNVTIGEHIFEGHFPGHPIYPGVMIVEGMAQAGGIHIEKLGEALDRAREMIHNH